MDIVIPLGKGGHKFGDIELKYALRSIEKYLTGYRDIFIVGEYPVGISSKTEKTPSGLTVASGLFFIPAKDTPMRKQFSIMNKLLTAIKHPCLSEDFLYFNDDHFLLKPLHVSDIKNWYEGTIKDHISKAVGKYKTACENTFYVIDGVFVFEDRGNGGWAANPIEGKYFDIHTPCIFNKAGIRDLSHLNWKENEYIIKSLYLNINKGEEEEMEDCKINQPKSKKEIEERIKDRLFFSTGHNAIKPPMLKVLEELFPEKSSYET